MQTNTYGRTKRVIRLDAKEKRYLSLAVDILFNLTEVHYHPAGAAMTALEKVTKDLGNGPYTDERPAGSVAAGDRSGSGESGSQTPLFVDSPLGPGGSAEDPGRDSVE